MTADPPLPPDPTPARWPWGEVLLGGIALLALGLRWPYLTESLWLDELHTSWVVADGWGPIWERATVGNYSPLYFWLVRLVVEVLGHAEWTLRWPSLLAGTLLVPAVGLVAWRWTGSLPVGLLAAWMAAWDELGILFSVEARPYALVALLGVLHVALTVEMNQAPSVWRSAAWVLLGAVIVYLHYTAALLLVAEGAWYLCVALWRRMWPEYGIYYALIDGAILFALCLPGLLHLLAIGAHRDEWAQFVPRPGAGDLFVLLPVARDLGIPLALAAVWAVIPMLRGDDPRVEGLTMPSWLPLAAAWLFVPLVTTWVLSANDFSRLFHVRYLHLATPALFILAAAPLARLPEGLWRWGYAALLIVTTLLLGPKFPWEPLDGPVVAWLRDGAIVRHAFQDWRGAIGALEADRANARGPILVSPGLIEESRLGDIAGEYLSFPLRGLYRVRHDPVFPVAALRFGDPRRAILEQIHKGRGWRAIILESHEWPQPTRGRLVREESSEGLKVGWFEVEQ